MGKGSSYTEIKGLDLIVITDGTPGALFFASCTCILESTQFADDNNLCKLELEKAAKHVVDNNYHPNHIGVQFVQIGNDSGARDRLSELAHANVNVSPFCWPYQYHLCYLFAFQGMVDTVSETMTLTGDGLERILLGATHPNLRVLQTSL